MSAHTPGPWRAFEPKGCEEPDHTYWYIQSPDNDPEKLPAVDLHSFISAADAHLIAASPDLLDLARNVGGLDDALLRSADLNSIRATLREFRDQARAAIAKAEGRAP